jgi:hypothetical protein
MALLIDTASQRPTKIGSSRPLPSESTTTGTVPDGFSTTKTPLTVQGTGVMGELDIIPHPDNG